MSLREIVLDTETTGLRPEEGHRIVEIGCIELVNHLPTGRTFQTYLNPERSMEAGATAVSGITDDMLRDKPRFPEMARGFLDFLSTSPLVIHNAAFDMGFVNHELRLAGFPLLLPERAIDTVAMARQKFPGSPASLDALCKRFNVDLSERVKHGALLDARLLACVYLELIGGRQPHLALAGEDDEGLAGLRGGPARAPRPAPLAPLITAEEEAAHAAFVLDLGPKAIWKV
jgi:DNA polymerase-3 subunit epsilon